MYSFGTSKSIDKLPASKSPSLPATIEHSQSLEPKIKGFEIGKMTGRNRPKVQVNIDKNRNLIEDILEKMKQKRCLGKMRERNRLKVNQGTEIDKKESLYMGRSFSRSREERNLGKERTYNMKNCHVKKCIIEFNKNKVKPAAKEIKSKKGMSFVQLLAEHGFLNIGIKSKSRYLDGLFEKPLAKKILEKEAEYSNAEVFEL